MFKRIKGEKQFFGDPTLLKRSVRKGDLDSIGTIGTNLCELYIRESNAAEKEKIMRVLESLAKSVYTNIPRMENGCFTELIPCGPTIPI